MPLTESIAPSKVETLFSDWKLHKLELNACKIRDEGICRLLGLDAVSVGSSTLQHPLRTLLLRRVDTLTKQALSTTLAACGSLQHLELQVAKAGTIELFQSDQPWPCASSLQEFSISLDTQLNPPRAPLPGTQLDYVMLSAEQQDMIHDHIKCWTGLRPLVFYAQPLVNFSTLEDMSFAMDLEKAEIILSFAIINNFRSARAKKDFLQSAAR
ncbi:hypothetical protein BG000_006838 [Podila horticola]|nr:hypothetical protein BG000_006838 [Podila horticola]